MEILDLLLVLLGVVVGCVASVIGLVVALYMIEEADTALAQLMSLFLPHSWWWPGDN